MKPHASQHRGRHRPRALLSVEQAIEIYKLRRCWKFDSNGRFVSGATIIAKNFNISPKTVRDIWNRRTWSYETRHLWDDDTEIQYRPQITHLRSEQQCCTCCNADPNASIQQMQPLMPSFDGTCSRSRSPKPFVDNSSSDRPRQVQLAFHQSPDVSNSDTNTSRWHPYIPSDLSIQGLQISHLHIIEMQETIFDEKSDWDLKCPTLTAPDPFLLDWPLW